MEQMSPMNNKAKLEAILFTMGGSVELQTMADALELDKKETRRLLLELQEEYDTGERGISLIELDGSWQMCTRKEAYETLIRIASRPKKHSLTEAVLETLSIIAYKQPVTKVEIEKIRGVSADHAVNRLVEYGLVTELGRLDAPGRPILFGTTEEFLRCFGVSNLEELPAFNPVQVEEFKLEAEAEAPVEVPV